MASTPHALLSGMKILEPPVLRYSRGHHWDPALLVESERSLERGFKNRAAHLVPCLHLQMLLGCLHDVVRVVGVVRHGHMPRRVGTIRLPMVDLPVSEQEVDCVAVFQVLDGRSADGVLAMQEPAWGRAKDIGLPIPHQDFVSRLFCLDHRLLVHSCECFVHDGRGKGEA